MPDEPIDTSQKQDENGESSVERPELAFDPGEIAPCWASPYPDAELTDNAQKYLSSLCLKISNLDIAARRNEISESWESRLYDRGRQYLFPRKGGGWLYIPFSTNYTNGRGNSNLYGNETNIYAMYGEIISAALTRDIPGVRFSPQNPSSDADITAKDAATNYARVFARNNDLLDFQQQLAYYLRTDGRALVVTDHIIDAQAFGRCDPETPEPVVPETEASEPDPFVYVVRHGETDLNKEGKLRGQSEMPINEKGERQMESAADWLKDKGIQLIVSSPLERAMGSAKLISDKLGVPMEVDDRLTTLDYGSLSGDDAEQSTKDIDEAFRDRPDEAIAGGESPNQFNERVKEAVMDWLSNESRPTALLVHDSVVTQIFKILQGEELPSTSILSPGGIAAITPNPDGTFKPLPVYPFSPPETGVGEQRGSPRGQEVVKVYGKLEHKVPFSANNLEESGWVQLSKEYDVALVKAMFPDHADKIKPGGGSGGANQLDRIARINVSLALEASYVTGDSMVTDCTVQRTWIRPGFYMDCEDVKIRSELFEKLPDGCLVIQASNEFIGARNENMDDHLTLIEAFAGAGMNRLALCSKLLSVQKRLNNWLDLLDQYFTRCVPMRYMAQGPFDVAAIQNQPTVVGGITPYLLDAVPQNRAVTDLIFVEPVPTPQPQMADFIKWFANELPQMISHALPSLFGAASNTDTATGIMVQRDQALGCLGTPWHAIQMGTARYFKQAVQLAARCRTEAVEGLDGDTKIRIELADLKGNILAYPESDANFPETWIQKQSRWMQLMQDSQNPLLVKLLGGVQNRIAALEALALEGVKDPDADAYEKQMGEFEVLLKTGPVPNPEFAQAQMALQESQQQIQAHQSVGVPASPQDIALLQQMEKQLQTIPPLISSVPVKDTDRHEVEAECCLIKINSPDGRKLADGNQQDRLAFQNVTLHYQEHEAKIQPAGALPKPPSLTINYKDLPPDPAAKLLTDVGLSTTGQDVVQNREFNAVVNKSAKIGGPPTPQVGQQQGEKQ